jgi:hypothetical protein
MTTNMNGPRTLSLPAGRAKGNVYGKMRSDERKVRGMFAAKIGRQNITTQIRENL